MTVTRTRPSQKRTLCAWYGRRRHYVVIGFRFNISVGSSVAEIVNTYYIENKRTDFDANWHKEVKGQRSRSHAAEVRKIDSFRRDLSELTI